MKFFEYGGGLLSQTEMRLPGSSQTLRNGDKCPDGSQAVLQVYVNGLPVDDWSEYIPQDGDRVRIVFEPPRADAPLALDDFIRALSDRGLAVESSSPVNQPFLSIGGTSLSLAGFDRYANGLSAFVYADTTSRIEDSSWLGDDLRGSLPLIEWIATPHLYARHNLLVLLVSDDPGLVTAVEAVVAALDR